MIRTPFFLSVYFLIWFFCLGIDGQNKHIVTVTSNEFNPKDITVFIGDTVVWNNIEGYHNVNGNTSVYPNNPMSFGNSTSTNWTYTYVFTQAGVYNYQCDPHVNFGMVGSITVEAPSSISATPFDKATIIYPNPVRSMVSVVVNNKDLSSIRVYDLAGKLQVVQWEDKGDVQHSDFSSLQSGIYFIQVEQEERLLTKRILKL